MTFTQILTITIVVVLLSSVDGKLKHRLDCLVCQKIVEEIETAIASIDPNKKVNLGNYRLDADGNQKQTVIPYARSQLHLSELLETMCERFKDYSQATKKDTGEFVLFSLIDSKGNMNPDIGNVDFVHDYDTNNKLKFYCETVVEDYEDAIFETFATPRDDNVIELCVKRADVCEIAHDEL